MELKPKFEKIENFLIFKVILNCLVELAYKNRAKWVMTERDQLINDRNINNFKNNDLRLYS